MLDLSQEPALWRARPYSVNVTRARLLSAAVWCSLSLSLLAACGDDDDARVIDTPDAAVLVAAPADGGDDALVSGEVTVVDGCLGINEDVAVWPFGTKVTDPHGPVIEVPNLGVVTVGDHVEGAGGYMSARDLDDERSPVVPDSCLDSGLVVYRAE